MATLNENNIPSISSIISKDRNIYVPAPGETAFAIYLFQGFYENPETGEKVVDYPLNIWNGISVAGTVPLSSSIEPNNIEWQNSFEDDDGLNSLIIYIEFVCNKIIANKVYAPPLKYDIIAPSSSATSYLNQEAQFFNNINDVSVYRGKFTVNKQLSPLYIDGLYKIRINLEKSSSTNISFIVPVKNIYAMVGVSLTDSSDLIL